MRTLKYAILGLINRDPMTGYDLTREFNSNHLANFWYAKHSQVYPELSRLMEEELVTCEVVIQGEKMEKKLYSITEKGRQELLHWLMEDDPLGPTPKDVFRLRMYFSDFMSKEELHEHLSRQIDNTRTNAGIFLMSWNRITITRFPRSAPGNMETIWYLKVQLFVKNLISNGLKIV